MRHLKHVLELVVPLVIVGVSTLAVSPAAQDFASAHPGLVVYLVAAAGVLSAVYRAFQAETTKTPPEAPGPGSATMAAK